ncbi:hypothetical protein QYE76_035667 [Lolium multiflorum]|uniref:Uncharacterized protein n=1 Tax=Lolium multiflorum TaxID=4521 RepID=A0AAD8R231_LOLMU|nr:hypothetical protein QYE76_035667 [Lolium multiflorum]
MENYSLLMGAAAVMKMAVEMAAVSMEKPSGALPRSRGCRNRDSCPPDLGFAMAAARKVFRIVVFRLGVSTEALYRRRGGVGGSGGHTIWRRGQGLGRAGLWSGGPVPSSGPSRVFCMLPVVMADKKEGIMILMTMKSLSHRTMQISIAMNKMLKTPDNNIDDDEEVPLASVVRDPHLQDLLLEKTKGARRKSKLEQLETDSNTLLYDSGRRLEESRLRVALDVLQMKAKHGWTDTSVNDILEYLKDLLPAGNTCPGSLAEAKRITCPLDLPHEKYHACINDCIIYRKEHVDKTKFPLCDADQYKKRKKKAL